ncbi:putative alkylated DNA repair protein [Heterostelium album PN500]|uniref:Putative alkylated DNA repair protein n=1 Tax=Heterostelium pallidum (strain ATCC 26659 / Pp 5 / PN500) TaxID=670386 RepID=D3BAH9_HETP5|nr:putative alkylated DNA repair protein [Heterostelium album PN500]EFA81566.1 putative alkylated DNA repair protein [Heterostelium album PN500]|eukprot:XP_020433683.1 putative alkylated DNA repair protein [Heterostelium album PN500]
MEYFSRVLLPKKRKSEDNNNNNINNNNLQLSLPNNYKNFYAKKYNNEKYDNDDKYYASDIDFDKISPKKQLTIDSLMGVKSVGETEFDVPNPLPPLHPIPLKNQTGMLYWCKHFLSQKMSSILERHLLQVLNFEQHEMKMYEKIVPLPRLMGWMSDSDLEYARKHETSPWTPPMIKLKTSLETLLNVKFDYVLVNYYRNGKDHIGLHSDKEAISETTRTIASVSLGATRRFILKPNDGEADIEFSLNAGSLLVMAEETQLYWKHCVPKELKVIQPRINLTFRCMKEKSETYTTLSPQSQSQSSPLELPPPVKDSNYGTIPFDTDEIKALTYTTTTTTTTSSQPISPNKISLLPFQTTPKIKKDQPNLILSNEPKQKSPILLPLKPSISIKSPTPLLSSNNNVDIDDFTLDFDSIEETNNNNNNSNNSINVNVNISLSDDGEIDFDLDDVNESNKNNNSNNNNNNKIDKPIIKPIMIKQIIKIKTPERSGVIDSSSSVDEFNFEGLD